MRRLTSALFAVPLLVVGQWSASTAAVITPSDLSVSQLKLTGGSADYSGRFARKLDRLFEQPGVLVMDRYQPGPDIVQPIITHRGTFSLFTSGVQGDPAPTVTVKGDTITADLSSLFFGVSNGDRLRAWKIGAVATGSFDPDTRQFSLTWDRLLAGRHHHPAVFALRGTVIIPEPTPVPVSSTAVLFGSGLALLIGLWTARAWQDVASSPVSTS